MLHLRKLLRFCPIFRFIPCQSQCFSCKLHHCEKITHYMDGSPQGQKYRTFQPSILLREATKSGCLTSRDTEVIGHISAEQPQSLAVAGPELDLTSESCPAEDAAWKTYCVCSKLISNLVSAHVMPTVWKESSQVLFKTSKGTTGSLPSKSLQSRLRTKRILKFRLITKTVCQVCLLLTGENRNVEGKKMQNIKQAKRVGVGLLKADQFN